MKENRFARHILLSNWRQERLLEACIMVIGAGALGNEIIKNLALLGIGRLLIIDCDRIELTNLTRTVLFREQDLGLMKAEVAAKRAKELFPNLKVSYINGNVITDVGLGLFRQANIVIGAVDNISARIKIAQYCRLANVPFLDGGIWALGGEVKIFYPNDDLTYEGTLSEEQKSNAEQKFSCAGFFFNDKSEENHPIATNIFISSIIGGIIAQETVRYLSEWTEKIKETIVYNGFLARLHKSKLPIDEEETEVFRPINKIERIDLGHSSLNLKGLFDFAQRLVGEDLTLEFGKDFLLGLDCPICGEKEKIYDWLINIKPKQRFCPNCSIERNPRLINQISEKSDLENLTLNTLGVPSGEILFFRNELKYYFFELYKDVQEVWKL